MPIFTYFSVVGAALLALLFIADAKFVDRGPLTISSNFEGLPKPWKPELNPPLPLAKPSAIQVAAAPALDPKWQTEQTEEAPAQFASLPLPVPAPRQAMAKAELPKKQKQAARKVPVRDANKQRYAWRHDNGGLFGGATPWRF